MLSARHSKNWAKPNVYLNQHVFVLCIIESKVETMAQFKSTLLNLHALLQVFVISLAHVKCEMPIEFVII